VYGNARQESIDKNKAFRPIKKGYGKERGIKDEISLSVRERDQRYCCPLYGASYQELGAESRGTTKEGKGRP